MKQLVCEMCDGTGFVKQDGMFVCQSCGCKYSVEEARKLMSEHEDSPSQISSKADSTRLTNLLNLAKSSYNSKNYAQAEEFCNQVIALDGNNYAAWKLKGEAINYQINADNQRILEVYNCLMNAYNVLSDEEKVLHRDDILSSLKTCMEEEVTFWLNQFKENRPTEASLNRTKNAYVDAYNKMAKAFDVLDIDKNEKEDYLKIFDNFFIKKANAAVVSSWKTTVGYNYFRDDLDNLGKDWNRTPGRTETGTDYFRPSEEIRSTFFNETGLLVDLLEFCIEQFNDKTWDLEQTIYDNIIYLYDIPTNQCSYKPMVDTWTNGYGAVTDRSEYYKLDRYLTLEAKDFRRTRLKNLNADKRISNLRITRYKKEAAEAEQRAKEAKIAEYWAARPEEKAKMDQDIETFQQKKNELHAKIESINKEIIKKKKERDTKLPIEEAVDKQKQLIEQLLLDKKNCGLFNSKGKKEIQSRIDTIETPKLEQLKKQADAESDALFAKVSQELHDLETEREQLQKGMDVLNTTIDGIHLMINTNPFIKP